MNTPNQQNQQTPKPGSALNPEADPNAANADDQHIDDQAGGDGDQDWGPVELLAMEMGWRPDGPDPDSGREFVSAEQFIRRGGDIQRTMQKQIESLKQTVEQSNQAMVALREHQQKLMQAEAGKIDQQIDDLETQLDAAIEDADIAKSKKLRTQIDNLKQQKFSSEPAQTPQRQPSQQPAQTQTAPAQPNLSPAAQTWLQENPWYGTDDIMTQYADAQSDRFRGLPEARYFSELTKAVQTMFPDRFPRQHRQSSVEPPATQGGNRRTNQQKKFTLKDLTDDQRRLARYYEKQGVMKVDQYIQELVRIGELR